MGSVSQQIATLSGKHPHHDSYLDNNLMVCNFLNSSLIDRYDELDLNLQISSALDMTQAKKKIAPST